MSKGTVIKVPTATSREHPGTIKVTELGSDNHSEVVINALLSFHDPGFIVMENDYVELIITSGTECNATRKVLARGSVSDPDESKLMVTVSIPNIYEVEKNMDLTYNNYDRLSLANLDFVEFTNLTQDKKCDVSRKIESYGDLSILPDGERTGTITVRKAPGITSGTTMYFPLPHPLPSPFKVGDIVEFNVTGDRECEYVQVLLPK